MSYSFEINSGQPIEFKNFSRYIADQFHLQSIGKEDEVKFSSNISTMMSYLKTRDFGEKIEKIGYGLGKKDKEFEFIIDKYKFNVTQDVNFDRPIQIQDFGLKPTVLFTVLTIKYSEPEAKEYLITKCYDWYRKNYLTKKEEEHINVYVNDNHGYFDKSNSIPERSLETIYIPEKQKIRIRDRIDTFLKKETRDLFVKMGRSYKLIILLHGPPGTGKSSLIKSLASEFKKNICLYMNNRKYQDTDFFSSLRNLREDSFLVFEDADCIFNTENVEGKSGLTFSAVLNTFDGLASPVSGAKPLVVFVTTNHLDKLDKRLIRPGRIDMFEEIGEMKKTEIIKMVKVFNETSYTEELSQKFYDEIKSRRMKITPAFLELHFFKYLDQLSEAIENIDEIEELKKIVEMEKKDLYS